MTENESIIYLNIIKSEVIAFLLSTCNIRHISKSGFPHLLCV